MIKQIFKTSYFLKSMPIWILLLICIYGVMACEFPSLRIKVYQSQDLLDKLNDIVKNLSFSYIAGVIFFFLSDTIPYFRRRSIIMRHVKRSIDLIIQSIDDFSKSMNGKIWDKNTSPSDIYEDVTGAVYDERSEYKYKVQENQIVIMKNLFDTLNLNIDFILAQELYIDDSLLDVLEHIKAEKKFSYLCILSDKTNNYITIKDFTELISFIISMKCQLSNYQ